MGGSYDPREHEPRVAQAWDEAGCYRAPRLPAGRKFYNYDSGPFPNGPLHMGHVRTYVLGDIVARFRRAMGDSVLYATEWDAFGMPIEIEARKHGVSPRAHVERWIASMEVQMRRLGISYDWSAVRATCDPAYYRWTQALFLRWFERGVIERRLAAVPYCEHCDTALSRMQTERDRCWRCARPVERRRSWQWFVKIAPRAQSLLDSLDKLEGWSPQVRRLVRALVDDRRAGIGRRDWMISRQRAWGTPIPVVHCEGCGPVPVPEAQLPVELPDDVDWGRGAEGLADHPDFRGASCPACEGAAVRECATLDCFFDDVWCQLAGLSELDGPVRFDGARVSAWMPVDRFHSGLDTVVYLHLHRFFTAELHEQGELPFDEPILGHRGHEMVLARGRKMSKHLGNAVSPAALIKRYGADTVRVAVVSAAAPLKAIDWSDALPERSSRWLGSIAELYQGVAVAGRGAAGSDEVPTRAGQSLGVAGRRIIGAIRSMLEADRPRAALAELEALFRRIERFTRGRLDSGRLSAADRGILEELLAAGAVPLSLFAPHLAEQAWGWLGRPPFVVTQAWPGSSAGAAHGVSPKNSGG